MLPSRPILWLAACLALALAPAPMAILPHGGPGGPPVPKKPPPPPPPPPPDVSVEGRYSAPPKAKTGPARPDIAGSGPARSSARTGGSAPNRRASATRGATTAVFEAAPSWEYWWEFNRDMLLAELPVLAETGSRTPSLGPLTNRGRRNAAPAGDQLASTDRIATALHQVLTTEDHRLLCNTSVLALARVARPAVVKRVFDDVVDHLDHPDLSVQTSATLALGVLGAPRAMPLLGGLAQDSASGRRAVGGGRVPWQVRAYAALSLGLLDQPLSVDLLRTLVIESPVSDRDLRACAVTGLGLMGDRGREAALPVLLELLGSPDPDAVVGAHVPTALAHLEEVAAVPHLLATLNDPQTDNYTRQSCAMALGHLADISQAPVLESLLDLVENEANATSRHFALIALGRMAGRARVENREQLDQVLERLLEGAIEPRRRMDRSWSALACGLGARPHGPHRVRAVEALTDAYEDEHDPSFRAAYGLALALLDATTVAERLLQDYDRIHDDGFRGYAALALGMLEHAPARRPLLAAVSEAGTSPGLRVQLVRSLGYLHSPQVVSELLAALSRAQSTHESWSIARALGRLPDPAVVDGLLARVVDPGLRILPRAYSCEALGLVGEKTPQRFNARLAQDFNYMAQVDTIAEIAGL